MDSSHSFFNWVGRIGKMWPWNVTGDWQRERSGSWFFAPATHWWLRVICCESSFGFFSTNSTNFSNWNIDLAVVIWGKKGLEMRQRNLCGILKKIPKCFGTKRDEERLPVLVVFFFSCAFLRSSTAAQVRSGSLLNPRILLQNNKSWSITTALTEHLSGKRLNATLTTFKVLYFLEPCLKYKRKFEP